MIFVYRFCNANDSTTYLSHAAQQECSPPNDHWARKSILAPAVLTRALEHMDGKTNLSPFVSVATDVLALVKFGTSGGLIDIIYGLDHPERRAPSIAKFQVPENSVISTDLIAKVIPKAIITAGWMRARQETELLYFGNDIKRYQVSVSDNPYTNESFNQRLANEEQTHLQQQQQLEAEAADKLRLVDQGLIGKPKSLVQKLVQEDKQFFPNLRTFLSQNNARLVQNNIDLSAFQTTGPATLAHKLMLTLRRFDAGILESNDPVLRQAWLQFSNAYRQ